jgi:hypothetical protein
MPRIVPGRDDGAQSAPGRGASRASRMGWAQRLKRVFAIDVEKCDRCRGAVRIIACIEDPQVIEQILRHLGLGGALSGEALPRAPPATAGLFD